MELAVPPAIRVRFCRLDEAVRVLADAERNGERSILLVASAATRSRSGRRGRRSTS